MRSLLLAWSLVLTAAVAGPGPPPVPLEVQSLHFSGAFTPQQVVTAGGTVWVVESTALVHGQSCALAAVDPRTFTLGAPHPLPTCPLDVTAHNGRIYLATAEFTGTNVEQVRTMVFDTATGKTTLRSPLVMMLVGSAVAHTAFTYGDGSLWLYGLGGPGAVIERISPSSGSAFDVVQPAPQIGGTHPAMVAMPSGLWVSGGAGARGAVALYAGGSAPASTAFRAPGTGSILWLAAAGSSVWAEVARYRGAGTTVTTRFVSFDAAGNQRLETGPQPTADVPLVAAGRALWSLGVAHGCRGPQRLLEVNPTTGKTKAVLDLATPVEPCLTEGFGSQLVAQGRSLFVLEPTGVPGNSVLYRIKT